MIIKEPSGRFGIKRWLLSVMKGPKNTKVLLCIVLAFVILSTIVLSSIYLGMYLHKVGISYVINRMRESKTATIANYCRGFFAKPDHIFINAKYMDYQKLSYQREVALANRCQTDDTKDYVPATISHKDKIVEAKIRLKGDCLEHLQTDKWSFRVKIAGDNSLFGMSLFSLHHPRMRNYISEWIFHQALKREGILSLRYEFIKVTLNGKDLGIYALEEGFRKELIESNNYREGVIIKFNEDGYWANQNYTTADADVFKDPELTADIDAFEMKKILDDPVLYRQFLLARDLLESFRRGALPAHKVFDIKKLAKYFAISLALNTPHNAATWYNLRFYFNPITSCLEPIGFDAYSGEVPGDFMWDSFFIKAMKRPADDFYSYIFNDMVFLEEYARALARISKPSYSEELFNDIDKELKNNLNILYSEFPFYRFSKDKEFENLRYIRALLNPIKAMQAYFSESGNNHLDLTIGNIQMFPIEILGVAYKDKLLLPSEERTILLPKIPSKPVEFQKVTFLLNDNFAWEDSMSAGLRVKYRLLGMDSVRYEDVFPYRYLEKNVIDNDIMRQPADIDDVEFISVNQVSKKITIKPGKWEVKHNLIIPKGFNFVCSEGVELNITNGSKIISYSPLEFMGSEESPIVIYSGDSGGEGIAVLNSGGKSILKDVIFRNLSNPKSGGWELSGAVTFYESSVDLYRCQFIKNRAEDSFNAVRSAVIVDNCFFSSSFSDALDMDFCKGSISNSSFIDCGNDAIDLSGSFITMRHIFVRGAMDKGVSIGENSHVNIDNIEIEGSNIAIASKDISDAYLKNVILRNCKTGYAVYRKKPEFGPSSMTIERSSASNVGVLYSVDDGSTLLIEGKRITRNDK